ncbi:hypothetical protein AOLI_G00331270 [Acnodon oligacanthus]
MIPSHIPYPNQAPLRNALVQNTLQGGHRPARRREGQCTDGQILHGAPDSLFQPAVTFPRSTASLGAVKRNDPYANSHVSLRRLFPSAMPREKAMLSAQWPPRLIASVSHRPGASMEIAAAVIGRRRTRNTLHSADLSYGTDRSHRKRPERKELTETEISRFSG